MPLLLLVACSGNSSSAQESISPSKSSQTSTSVEPISTSESTSIDPNILVFGGMEFFKEKLPLIPEKVKITNLYTYNNNEFTTEKVGNDFLCNNSSEPSYYMFYHHIGEGMFKPYTKMGEEDWKEDEEEVNFSYVAGQTNLEFVLRYSTKNSVFYRNEATKVASGVDYDGIICDKYEGHNMALTPVYYLVDPLTNILMQESQGEGSFHVEENVTLDTSITGFSIEVPATK